MIELIKDWWFAVGTENDNIFNAARAVLRLRRWVRVRRAFGFEYWRDPSSGAVVSLRSALLIDGRRLRDSKR